MNENIAKIIFKTGAAKRNPGLFDVIKKLQSSDFWSKDQLIEIQNRKLELLFSFLKKHNSLYAEKLLANQANIDPRAILNSFPIIDKSYLLANLNKLTNYEACDKLILAETSGSTGEPFKFKKNVSWDTANRASFIRAYNWYGVQPWQRNGYFWGYSLDPAKHKKTLVLDELQNRFRVFSYNIVELKSFLEKLKSAVYLHGYSSMIYEVAKIAIDQGYSPADFPKLKLVKGTSEKIYDYYHPTVKAAFGHRIVSEYGSAEAGIIAFECPFGHMHVNEENVILEVVDGQAVATNLNAYSLPIIRYKVGDAIALDETTKCECGRQSTIVKEIQGRVGKKIIGKESNYPSLTLYYVFKNISLEKGVDIQYQAVQQERGKLDLRVTRTLTTDERNWIKQQCENYFRKDVDIRILENEDIHDKKGKLKDFVSTLDL